MPFDGPDLDQPNLKSLSFVLRNKSLWPDDFEWNYCHSRQCALGLADRLWGVRGWKMTYSLPRTIRHRIFIGLGESVGIAPWNVRPEYVADAIDQWLASGMIGGATLRRKMKWFDRLFGRL